MRSPTYALIVASALLSATAPAFGATTIVVSLTNTQEPFPVVPTTTTLAPRPIPFGTATLVLNDAMSALTYAILVSNIDFTGTQTADINDT